MVTAQDKLDLIRLAGLIGRHRDVLSDFEAGLVDDCVLRLRDRGERMSLTDNERQVLLQALAGLDKAATAGRGETRRAA
jgi:hypothetical protein